MSQRIVLQTPTALWAFMLLIALGLLAAAHAPATSEPLAGVDGEAVAADEVEKAIAAQLSKLEEQSYTLKRQKLEALIADRLLAQEGAKRGITVQAPLDAEVTTTVRLVTELRSRPSTRHIRPNSRGKRPPSGSGFEPTSRIRGLQPDGRPLFNPSGSGPRSWCTCSPQPSSGPR
jgi:hypothetical protein